MNGLTVTSMFNFIKKNFESYKAYKLKNGIKIEKFGVNFLERIKIPGVVYNLEILVDTDNNIYSCNNRRLCLLKKLTEIGFDGEVMCKAVDRCHHDITVSDDVFIQKGNERGEYCLASNTMPIVRRGPSRSATHSPSRSATHSPSRSATRKGGKTKKMR